MESFPLSNLPHVRRPGPRNNVAAACRVRLAALHSRRIAAQPVLSDNLISLRVHMGQADHCC